MINITDNLCKISSVSNQEIRTVISLHIFLEVESAMLRAVKVGELSTSHKSLALRAVKSRERES